MADSTDAVKQVAPVPPKVSWLKRVVRYGIHLIILYQIVTFSIDSLSTLLYRTTLLLTGRPAPSVVQEGAFLLPHLVAFSVVPAFFAGLIINARFRHRAAEYIWLAPAVFLAYECLFHGPGIYPTMLADSDFPKAFHFFFGGGLPTDMTNWHFNWIRVNAQVRFTMPAYGALAYSFGAYLGMSPKSAALQRLAEKL